MPEMRVARRSQGTLISGNTAGLAALGASILAFIGWMTLKLRRARKDGINAQKVDHYEQSLKDLAAVRRAGDARPVGGVQSDPHNRDTWK